MLGIPLAVGCFVSCYATEENHISSSGCALHRSLHFKYQVVVLAYFLKVEKRMLCIFQGRGAMR